jgi:hypothetical protein
MRPLVEAVKREYEVFFIQQVEVDSILSEIREFVAFLRFFVLSERVVRHFGDTLNVGLLLRISIFRVCGVQGIFRFTKRTERGI